LSAPVPHFDLSLEELQSYRTRSVEPDDLDAFWARALAEARERATEPVFEPYEPGLFGTLAVDDVTFSGGDGHPIRAWFMRPREATQPLACLVKFMGYGGGRDLPVEHALYPAAGHAVFVMDTRSQGGTSRVGATGDPGAGSSGTEHPGVMTRGILDPERYFYRRLYVDAVRAVETARAHPAVDPDRIAVGGVSQGGGLALAAAALAPDLVRVCHADVPFLCDIERGMTMSSDLPYLELVNYLAQNVDLVETARRTLAYVDCAHLASRIRARCLVSVGLMDTICPPSCVFAAYNAITAPKELAVYEYAGHDVPARQTERRLAHFVAELGV
jgi:cephalosporin-C deacetylase